MRNAHTNLSDYELCAVIATGANSIVHCAIDRRTGAVVAIKQVTSPRARHFSRQEAALLKHVHHPALPMLYTTWEDEDGVWLVMEYIPGDDLAVQIEHRPQPFPASLVLTWADQVLDALGALHAHTPPIMHGDIKPRNLKVDAHGQVHLLDFGAAHTAAHDMAGYTLAYAAPEQVTGGAIDPRADLYALAATLYDLLTGVKPPDARLRLSALAEGRSDPLLPASAWNPRLTRGVDAFLQQGMALDPAYRFANADAMRVALQGCCVDPSSSAPPVPPIEIIGRNALIGEVRRKLLHPDVRLLTLVGPGGVGKTTVAHAVAGDLSAGHFCAVTFIDLENSSTTSAQQNPPSLQEIVARWTAQPSDDAVRSAEPTQDSPSVLLLVLDAVELLASGKDALGTMIANSPSLKVLATGRQPIGALFEHLLVIPPLPTPDPHTEVDAATALHSPAVQMFLAQAKACDVDLQITDQNVKAIVDLCANLDGLPFALKEAARCLCNMEITEIVEHLFACLSEEITDPTSPRQRHNSLAASLAWSIEQLTPKQQRLLMRLTVFRGSFSPHAAHAICCTGAAALESLSVEDVAASLRQIAEQSLLVMHRSDAAPRYAMLNTTRAYTSAHLGASDDIASLRRRHADYFVNLIDTGDTYVMPDVARRAYIEAEYDNLLAALTWSVEQGDATVALRLTTSLWRFWEIRGDYREGLAWFERALALSASEDELRARALACAGGLARNQSQYTAAERCFSDALTIYRQLDDRQGIARMLNSLGTVAFFRDALAAKKYFEAALELHRELHNQHDMAGALNNLALLAEGQGDYAHAAILHQQALELFQLLGEDVNSAYALGNLGVVAEHSGDLTKAADYYQRSLDLHELIGEKWGMAAMLTNLGSTLDRMQQTDAARPLLIEGLTLFHELADNSGVAQALSALARNAEHCKTYEDSIRFLAAAERIESEIGYVLPAIEQTERQAICSRLRDALGANAYDAAWNAIWMQPLTAMLTELLGADR
ncbi:MAG TPA: tetratricopeptide repeat protein [Chloroflexi bacterium]|nr:tetratricopeptide repeat protein [Chloroflexota bacterium]